jgi:glycosyltransferase involved in cell wall biosynthesis
MKKVLLVGIVDDTSTNAQNKGYSNACNGMLDVLKHMEKNKIIDKVDTCNTQSMQTMNINPNEEYDVGIFMIHPNSLLQDNVRMHMYNIFRNVKKRILSVVWETSRLPIQWTPIFQDDFFHGFCSPSYFVLNQINTTKEKFYLPHFIDYKQFKKINYDTHKKDEKVFTVLWTGQYTHRKNLRYALKVFVTALGHFSDTKLCLKYHDMSDKEVSINDLIRYEVSTNCMDKNWKSSIHTLNKKLSFEELNDLYLNSSLLLSCSHGEGFGLTQPEGSCVGLPSMYTNFGGLSEVSSFYGNIPLDFYLDSATNMSHHSFDARYMKYAFPLVGDGINKLTALYKFWKEDKKAYYDTTKDNYIEVDEKFGLKEIKKYLLKILK